MAANREAIPSQLQTDRKHQNCVINDDGRAGSGSHLLLQGKQRQQAPLKWARNSHCGAAAAAAVRKTGALCLKELQQRHFPRIRLVTITVGWGLCGKPGMQAAAMEPVVRGLRQ